jgi:repressor LexA
MSDLHQTFTQPLSLKEKSTLEYIEGYIGLNGVAPTFQEIKEHFGFASFNSVQRYIKQLQLKGYIGIPAGNQKRAITVLHSSSTLKNALNLVLAQTDRSKMPESEHFRSIHKPNAVSTPKKAPVADWPQQELFSLPMLGKVAAGRPIESMSHEEFVSVPPHLVREPRRSFTLRVAGQSMIDDGIFDGDILIIQEQKQVNNGEICVCTVENEATVKRFYLHSGAKLARPQVELRPANSQMESMWYGPEQVEIRGVVVGLLRKF